MNPIRSSRWLRWFVVASFCTVLAVSQSCSPPPRCTGESSSNTINPQDSPCEQRCECNNQMYEGFCIKGICKSFPRERCQVKGKVQDCYGLLDRCEGRQVCRPEYLLTDMWGDCVCTSTGESTKETAFEPAPEAKPEIPTESTLPEEAHHPKENTVAPDERTSTPEAEIPESKDGASSEPLADADQEGIFERIPESPSDITSEQPPESALESTPESIQEPVFDAAPENTPDRLSENAS